MIIELGGGTRPHPNADVIIDLHHPKNAPAQNATKTPWQYFETTGPGLARIPDACADLVCSSHFLEHIPHGQGLLDVMNEAWRVLKPGGAFEAVMPLVGYTDPATGDPKSNHIGWQPWADPTHVSYWWLPEAFYYFCEGPFKPNADYGMKTWGPMGHYLADPVQAAPGQSYWSVREGWEGYVRIIK